MASSHYRTCHVMTTLFNWSGHGGQNEDRTLLQRSQRCHKGEFRHRSISTRQRWLRCGQNLFGVFLRATLPITVGSCARTMADNGETKELVTPPPRCFCTIIIHLCHCMIAITTVYSESLQPFPASCEVIYIIYIRSYYAAQFFTYQECNYLYK